MHDRRVKRLAAAACVFALAIGPVRARDIWLSPPDSVSQPANHDFPGFADHPESWAGAARGARVFSVTISYLMRADAADARRLLAAIRAAGLTLDVQVPGLQVDKHVCGDGVEGMVWPGEIALFTERLLALGAAVDSFGFDLPLTSGVVFTGPGHCAFTVAETARRLAATVTILRTAYPHATMSQAEVITGMPVARWDALLRDWLAAYRAAAGEDIGGFSMDVWYQGDWLPSVRATTAILRERRIPAGLILDASETGVPAARYLADTRAIECALMAAELGGDFVVVADWLDLNVPNLPDGDPDTLMGLARWLARPDRCAGTPD